MQKAKFTAVEMSEGIVVAIMIEAKEGQSEAVAGILEGLVAPTMSEPGVKLFLPCRSPTNPLSFFIFELYVDEAGWSAHQSTAHFKEAIEDLLPRLSKRERVPFVPFATV